MGTLFEAFDEGVLMVLLDPRYTQDGFNFISVQVCSLSGQIYLNASDILGLGSSNTRIFNYPVPWVLNPYYPVPGPGIQTTSSTKII